MQVDNILLRIPGETPFELRESDLSVKAKKELARLEKAATDVESIFVKDLLSKMMPKEAFGTGPFSGFLKDQFQAAVAGQVSQAKSFGIASLLNDKLRESLLRQEAARLMAQPQENQP